MKKKQDRRDFLKQFGIVGTTVLCCGPLAMTKQEKPDVSGFEHIGDIRSWKRVGNAIVFDCSKEQKVMISVLTGDMFRVQFSADGVFNPSELIDWGLVNPDSSFCSHGFKVMDSGKEITVDMPEIKIEIKKSPFKITVKDKNGNLLTREGSQGMSAGDGARLQMDKFAGEHFFGMGVGIGTKNPDAPFKYYRYSEFGNLSIHGTQLEESIVTLDQAGKKTFFCLGPNWSGQCMTPAVVPFFMSTRGYGIYLNNFRDSVFDLGNSDSNSWSVTLGGPPNHVPNTDYLDYYFIYGPSFKKILDSYTDLTGKTPILPKWSLGYFHICHFMQDQPDVLKIARDFRQRDFPCDTLLLEPGWMNSPYEMDGWSAERFSDPDSMIDELTKQGYKLGLWQCGPADWIFTSWTLFKRNGNKWGVDITNPYDVKNYQGYHRPYYDQGITFFKQDGCGQSEWMPYESYHNGQTGKEMHNIIPTLYSKIMDKGYKEHTGKRYVNFNPMIGPSQQRYPGVWPSGDAGGGFGMFLGEINMGMSGHTYTTHDFGDRSPAGIHWSLLGPWMPGALSGPPQGEISGIKIQNRAPSDEPTVNMCQFYLKLRYRLIPYIYSTHQHAHKTGTPYMRAMVLEYQDDPVTYNLDHQCMLGDWFLMAAYTNDVYLPAGMWYDYWTGEAYESAGEWKKNHLIPATVGGPLFVKGGAIIPMAPVMAYVDKEPLEIVVLDIYPYKTSTYILYEDDGETYAYETGAFATTMFSCTQTGRSILVDIEERNGTYNNMPENRSYLLSVHCKDEPVKVSKGTRNLVRVKTKDELFSDGAKRGWFYDRQHKIIWIKPMAGWYYSADERGNDDPEKDTVYWVDTGKHEDGKFTIRID